MHELPKIGGSYKPASDSFLKKSGDNWVVENCRDRMQSYFNSYPEQMDFYFFAENAKNAKRVIKFMEVVEPAASVEPENRIKIELTTDKTVVHIVMSPWWRNPVRSSLLTALLRCGQNYSDESAKGFDKALNSVEYTSKTRTAIDFFLSGNTAIKKKSINKDKFGGWYNLFSQANFDPSKVLVRVKRKKKEEVAENADALEVGEVVKEIPEKKKKSKK